MVSVMDVEPTTGEICDNRPILGNSAVSQRSIEIQIPLKALKTADTKAAHAAVPEVLKKNLKLELASPELEKEIRLKKNDNSTSDDEIQRRRTASHSSSGGCSSKSSEDENAKNNNNHEAARTPKSPRSPLEGAQGRFGSRMIPHQNSLTSQLDVVDDRKALRDALYQGIFHRHRRTIFAMGSFLRMLKSKNAQYNSISQDSEDDPR